MQLQWMVTEMKQKHQKNSPYDFHVFVHILSLLKPYDVNISLLQKNMKKHKQ